jgi:predicted nucleic-acid-binding Zn-ribbon protein
MRKNLIFETPDKTCTKCAATMEKGFIADYTYGDSSHSVVQNVWIQGEFEKNWMGAKIKNQKKFLMTTFRCKNCGYLESFALEEKL